MKHCLVCFLICLASCGARTDLELSLETSDAAVVDAFVQRDMETQPDMLTQPDADLTPVGDPAIPDVWWAETIRAVCDLVVFQFCDPNTVSIRVAYDSGLCVDPSDAAPSQLAEVVWLSSTEFQILYEPPTNPNGSQLGFIGSEDLVFEFVPSDSGERQQDTLRWSTAAQGPWTMMMRSSAALFPQAIPIIENFVSCP